MPNPAPPDMRGYFDEEGVLLLWPAKGRAEKRVIALTWLAGHFEFGESYNEREVNAILDAIHAFKDAAFLRRELVDRGFLTRDVYGANYRRVGNKPDL